ncbi:hypothetical protein BXZ70DRAFT_802161 [Cristinia sonorae]|uniref:Uncharacterized protein n=1 Tax=Cristinia sonorae TaxID=1940300 RepID=A0A8K0USB1_9AGAR|nr:hypothetical protein BXZ70DRAFT_802161 [Cristinia sonorae]
MDSLHLRLLVLLRERYNPLLTFLRRTHPTIQPKGLVTRMLLLLTLVLWVVYLVSPTSGRLVNHTIDDENGDEVTGQKILYLSKWNQGNVCDMCATKLNESMVYDGTWHDVTYIPSRDSPMQFSFTFTGVAVYLFFVGDALHATNVDILLDGQQVGSFNRPQNQNEFEYNLPGFVSDSLPNQEHNIFVTTTGSDDDLVLFDYAIYTVDESLNTAPLPSLPQLTSSDQATQSSPTSTQPTATSTPQNQSDPSKIPLTAFSDTTPSTRILSETSQALGTPAIGATPNVVQPLSGGGIQDQDGHHLDAKIVAGGVAGVVGVLFILLFLWALHRRRRQQQRRLSPIAVTSGKQLRSEDSPVLTGDTKGDGEGLDASESMLVSNLEDTVSVFSPPENDETAALRHQLQICHSELESLRTRSARSSRATFGGGTPLTRRRTMSRAVISLDSKLTQWREQVAEVSDQGREAQDQRDLQNPTRQSPVLDGIQRELQILRTEIEDLRSCVQLEPLPGYTTSSNAASSPTVVLDPPPRALL